MDTIRGKVIEVSNDYENVFHITVEAQIPSFTRHLRTKARLRRVGLVKRESLKQTGNLSRLRADRLEGEKQRLTTERTGCDRNVAVLAGGITSLKSSTHDAECSQVNAHSRSLMRA